MQIKYRNIYLKILVLIVATLLSACGFIHTPAISLPVSQETWYCENYKAKVSELDTLAGPEDIAVDFKKSIAYISSAEVKCKDKENCGGLFVFKDDKLTKLSIADNPDTGFTYSLIKPHGISLYLPSNNTEKSRLFVINHTNNDSEDFVDIFEINDNDYFNLTHVERINSTVYSGFNDLVAVSKNEFYITANGGAFNRNILISFFGLPLSEVLFYDGKTKAFNNVKGGLRFANGIVRGHNKLYVSTTIGSTLYSWNEIVPGRLNTASEVSVPLGTMLDNIHWSSKKKEAFFLTGHNNALKFLAANKNNCYSPSSFYKIKVHPKTGDICSSCSNQLTLVDKDKTLLSASSALVIIGEKLFVGSVIQKKTLPICNKK